MSKSENATCNEQQDDVIVLGVASVETMGMRAGNTEVLSLKQENGISEE